MNRQETYLTDRKAEILKKLKDVRLRSVMSAGAAMAGFQRDQLEREKLNLYTELAAVNKELTRYEKANTP